MLFCVALFGRYPYYHPYNLKSVVESFAATVRERSPGVWEVRVFVGRDPRGKPIQVSRSVRGTKRAAQKVAASLTVEPPAPEGNRSVAEALDAWLEVSGPTWAVSTLRDQTSRVSLVKRDVIARTVIGRLTVADVDRWHARLRSKGVGESSIPESTSRDACLDVARRRAGDG